MTREEALDKLRKAKPALSKQYGIVRLGIFGSTARNEATSDSDVDIIVYMTDPDIFELVGLRDDLVEMFGTEIDLVHHHAYLRPSFLNALDKEAVYV